MSLTDYRSAAELGQIVPVIDLAPAFSGDPVARATVVREIDEVSREIGFFVIAGHGVDPELVDAVRRTGLDFFALPEDEKQKYVSAVGTDFRGWSHRELDHPDGPVRVREQLEMSSFDSPEDILAAGFDQEWADKGEPNVWPETPADLETVWKAYYAAMDALGGRILSLMAEALGLEDTYFDDKFDRQASYLACNRYFAPQVELDGLRFGAHTDIGSLTILYQDDGPAGIEVLDRLGRWCPIDHTPGTFVVNLGDLLAKWTNDRWVATQHRVRNPEIGERRERVSIPYFQHPNYDTLIECLPGCASDENPPRYPSVLAGNWTEYRFGSYDNV